MRNFHSIRELTTIQSDSWYKIGSSVLTLSFGKVLFFCASTSQSTPRYVTLLNITSKCWKNKSILEIGAGVGLSSLIAAQYAHEVTCTDHNAISLELMKENFNLNSTFKTQNIKIINFNWNLSTDTLAKEIQSSQFDFIIASEILYLTSNVKPAFNVVTAFLKKEKGSKFVLIHEKRFSLVVGGIMETEDSVLTYALDYSKQCNLVAKEVKMSEFTEQSPENVVCFEFSWNEEALK